MAIKFYPQDEDLVTGTLLERLETLLQAAELYHAAILDMTEKKSTEDTADKKNIPRNLTTIYNWEAIAKVLHEIRGMPEATQTGKLQKADYLTKLAEIYEVLRAAKMPRLEAVRLALMNEASSLGGNGAQVA